MLSTTDHSGNFIAKKVVGKPFLARSHSALGHIESTAFHGTGSSGSSLEFPIDSSMVLGSNSDSVNGSRSAHEISYGDSMTTGSVFSPLTSKLNRQTSTGPERMENKIESVPILSIPALHTSLGFSSPHRENENNNGSHLSFAPVPYLQVNSSFNNSFSNPPIDQTVITSGMAVTTGLSAFGDGGQFQRVVRSSPHFSTFENSNNQGGLTQVLSISPYVANSLCVDDIATGDDTVSIARRQLHDVLRLKAVSPYVHIQNFQDSVDLGSDSLESSPSRSTFETDNGISNFRGRFSGYQTRGRNYSRRDGQNEHIMPHLNDENEHNMSLNRSLTVNNSFCFSDLKVENQKEKKIREKKRIKKSEAKIRRMSLAPSSRISKIKNKIIFDSPILDLTENDVNEENHRNNNFDLNFQIDDNDINTEILDNNKNSYKNSNFSIYHTSRRSSGILNILIDDLTDRFNTATVLSPAATAKLSSNKKKIKNKKKSMFSASYD